MFSKEMTIAGFDDELAAELVRRFAFQVETAENCSPENTIELQLPFIKYFFEGAKILAMGVPPNKSSLEIGRAVAAIAGQLGLTIKVIGSTDLTHYGRNYGFESRGSGKQAVDWVRNENDRRVIDAMLALDSEKVIAEARANQNACCAGAAATAIETAAAAADSAPTVEHTDAHAGDDEQDDYETKEQRGQYDVHRFLSLSNSVVVSSLIPVSLRTRK